MVACAIGCRGGGGPDRGGAPPADTDSHADARAAPIAAAGCDPASPARPDPDGLALVDQVAATMEVALSAPPIPRRLDVPHAEVAPPGAIITGVTLHAYRLGGEGRVPLTAAELDRVIFRGAVLRLRSFGVVVEHRDADCAYTLRDLLRAIEVSDRQTRGASPWFEGIDLHHVELQGLFPGPDGAWRVGWSG